MTDRRPFWVQCTACQHIWAAAYLPMEVKTFAKCAKASCPNCGNGPKGNVIPKQKNGVLLESSPQQGAQA